MNHVIDKEQKDMTTRLLYP